MARPKKQRRICAVPDCHRFVPQCDPEASAISLTTDEYEVIRLLDLQQLTQQQCAARMQVARTTVTGIYDSARKKLARMLVEGMALEIVGGDVTVCGNSGQCCGKCGVGTCTCDNPDCKCREDSV